MHNNGKGVREYMKQQKFIFGILALLLMASVVHAAAAYGVSVHPDSKLFSASEPLTGYIEIANHSTVSSHDTRIVLQLVPRDAQGPFNAVMEEVLLVGLVDGSSKQPFRFTLAPSESVPGGPYTLYTYVYANGQQEVGIPFTFFTPVKQDVFLTSDTLPTFRFDQIVLNRALNQFGPTIAAESPIQLSLSASSESTDLQSVTIRVRTCAWSDLDCLDEQPFVSEQTQTITLSSTQKAPPIVFSWTAPSIPGAYAVRIEAFDGDKLLRLDRSRFVVAGENGKIQGFYATQPLLLENQLVEFHADVTSFADRISGLPDGKLIFTLSSDDQSLLSQEKSIVIHSINEPTASAQLSFIPTKDYEQATACMELYNGDSLLDQECLHFRSTDYAKRYELLRQFPLSFTFDESNRHLYISYSASSGSTGSFTNTLTDPEFQPVVFQTKADQLVVDLATPAEYYTQKVVDLSTGAFATRRWYVSDATIINGSTPVVPTPADPNGILLYIGLIVAIAFVVVLVLGGLSIYRRIVKKPRKGGK